MPASEPLLSHQAKIMSLFESVWVFEPAKVTVRCVKEMSLFEKAWATQCSVITGWAPDS